MTPEYSHSYQLGSLQQAVRWFLASPTDARRQLLAAAFAEVTFWQTAAYVSDTVRLADVAERRGEAGR